MCGITFVFNRSAESAILERRTYAALTALAHRGPDDRGFWQEGSAAMGHRRLAIIDLSSSRQPMHDARNRFVLSYNGELYNYKELRRDLKKQWLFRTDGDTEVVLAGLAMQGVEYLKRMKGMWALALWDRVDQKLILARDRMGKKPLYYKVSRDGIACASELTALALLCGSSWQEDLDSTADYLRYGYYLPGTTAYQNVREVLPGHVLQWEPDTQPYENSYWSLNCDNKCRGDAAEAQEELDRRLVAAVRRRLVADVEVGAFLSGGVDSSLIVAIMSRRLDVHAKTFTIGFVDSSYDERRYARIIASNFHTDHYEKILAHWDGELLKTLVLQHVGQPFSDSSLLPTAAVAELASRHVKVALSGDGGDELFSGYQRYQGRTLLRWYTRLPKVLRVSTERLIRFLPEPMKHHSRSLLKKAHLFNDQIQRFQDEQPYVAPLFYSKKTFSHLAPDLKNRGHSPPHLPEKARLDSILEMMVSDALVYLPQDILVKVDRVTMAYSLEARAPFLDQEVFELAFSLPRYWHRHGMKGKIMLHKAFPSLLPRAIWRRRKQGFSVPIHEWFRGRLGEELKMLLTNTASPLSTDVVNGMLAVHRRRQRDHGYRLWGIYIYLLWQQRQRTLGF